MGKIKITCAIIIEVGENSNPRVPKGPDLDSKRYTTRPTTTGGNPINELKKTTKAVLPGNCTVASTVPKGSPKTPAIKSAIELTLKDKTIISIKYWSKPTIKANAAANAYIKSFIRSSY